MLLSAEAADAEQKIADGQEDGGRVVIPGKLHHPAGVPGGGRGYEGYDPANEQPMIDGSTEWREGSNQNQGLGRQHDRGIIS